VKRPVITLAASLCLLAGIACKPSAPAGEAPDLAVLAQSAADFEQARPGRPLAFPRDHGAHPGYRIEWWYLTANLQDAEARPYGAQWTLFRFATRPPGSQPDNADANTPWQSEQVFMAHLALTTPEGHVAFQRYARGGDHGGVAQAGARAQPFAAWLDDWRLASTGDGWLPLALHAGQGAGQDGFAVDLRLDGTGPLVPQGDEGFSQKHPGGGGSYYYSQPFLAASGTLRVDGRAVPVTGQAWLDREWSSQFLQPDQAGWDWFALHLDSGEKLMLFRLRSRSGEADYLHGVLIGGDGSRRALDPSRIRLQALRETVVAGRALPLHWRIDLPEIERSLELQPLRADQWLELDFPYWEGAVLVRGEGARNRGEGYLELTGYPRR
jgi:predicted secreted hydrolase